MSNRLTRKSSFEVVYTQIPRLTVDLANLPSFVDISLEAEAMADRTCKLHQEIKDHLEQANSSYKTTADSHTCFKNFKLVILSRSISEKPTCLLDNFLS